MGMVTSRFFRWPSGTRVFLLVGLLVAGPSRADQLGVRWKASAAAPTSGCNESQVSPLSIRLLDDGRAIHVLADLDGNLQVGTYDGVTGRLLSRAVAPAVPTRSVVWAVSGTGEIYVDRRLAPSTDRPFGGWRVDLFDSGSGRPVWPRGVEILAVSTTASLIARHVLSNGDLALVLSDAGSVNVTRISRGRGEISWSAVQPLAGTGTKRSVVDRDGNVAVAVFASPEILRFAGESGSVSRLRAPGNVVDLAFDPLGRLHTLLRPVPLAQYEISVLDPAGHELRRTQLRWSGPSDERSSIVVGADGSAAVAIFTQPPARVSMIDSSGAARWDRELTDDFVSMAPDDEGGLLILRYTRVERWAGADGSTRWTREMDAYSRLWSMTPLNAEGRLLLVDYAAGRRLTLLEAATGSVAWSSVSGEAACAYSPVRVREEGEDLVIVSSNQELAPVLERRSSSSGLVEMGPVTLGGGSDYLRVVFQGGDVYTAGIQPFSPGGCWIARTNTATGVRAFGTTYPVPPCFPRDLAVAPNGDAVLLFVSDGIKVARFDGRSGDIVWGPFALHSDASRMTMDSSGDLYLYEGNGPLGSVTKVTGSIGGPLLQLWKLQLSDRVDYFPSFFELEPDERSLLVGGFQLLKVDTTRGALLFRVGPFVPDGYYSGTGTVSAANPRYARLANGDVVMARPTERNRVARLDGRTGLPVWESAALDDRDRYPALSLTANGDVALAYKAGTASSPGFSYALVELSAVDGSIRRSFDPIQGSSNAVHLVEGGLLVKGSESPADPVGLVMYGQGLAVDLDPSGPIVCGEVHRTVSARNGLPPYRFDLTRDVAGLVLDPVSGELTGRLTETVARIDVRVTDAAGATASRELTLFGAPVADAPIAADVSLVCPGGRARLSLPAGWSAVEWRPGGERSASLEVRPARSTTYEVVARGPDGCLHTGALRIDVSTAAPLRVVAPAPITVLQTACVDGAPGATPSTDPSLLVFLEADAPSGGCQGVAQRLAPRLSTSSVDVTDSTFFPVGSSTVVFRYRDGSGGIVSSSSTVTVRALGDLDLSGRVDVRDVLLLAGFLGGLVPASDLPASLASADLDRNGTVDTRDLVRLVEHLVGNLGCLTP